MNRICSQLSWRHTLQEEGWEQGFENLVQDDGITAAGYVRPALDETGRAGLRPLPAGGCSSGTEVHAKQWCDNRAAQQAEQYATDRLMIPEDRMLIKPQPACSQWAD